MDARKLAKLRTDLTAFLDAVAGPLGHPRRRHWCDAYLRGVLLDGHRKSVEPMAARLRAIERGAGTTSRPSSSSSTRARGTNSEVLGGLHAWIGGRFGTDGFLIIDDTGFPKQGEHSVGVARQYTGTLGKVANCQVAVTLQWATGREVVALDAKLYLPESWTKDPDRLAKAGVPAAAGYQPKWELALTMIRRAVANGFRGVVLADSLFGTVTALRERLAADGRTYCVGIDSTLKVVAADADLGPVPPHSGRGRPPTRPAHVRAGATSPSVKEWAVARADAFRSVTWREGSKGKMTGRFAAWRVRPAHKLSAGKEPSAGCWPSGRRGPPSRPSTSSATCRPGRASSGWRPRPRAGGGWNTATAS